MTLKEKKKLSRRIERGLNRLYREQQRELSQANKCLKRAKKIGELRQLLMAAREQLWRKENG